jgi:opacity protein-like surface antigen
MKLNLLAGAAFVAVVAASAAQAASPNGWYGAIDAGWHSPSTVKAASANASPDGGAYSWNYDLKDNWAGFARLGYRVNPNWRVELEGGYRPGDLSNVSGRDASRAATEPFGLKDAGTGGSPGGHIHSWTVLGNLIYDFLPESKVNPFVGAGLGFNYVDVGFTDAFKTTGGTLPAFQVLKSDDSHTSVAYQLLAGLAWAASDRISVDLTYRYLGSSASRWSTTGSGPLQPGQFRGTYTDNSVTVGIRYAFAPPPPPPPN